MLYIDKKFLNIISPKLEKFSWKKENLANFRCFVCNDSEKNKHKARGYVFEKTGSLIYKCHNCEYSTNMGGLLRQLDPTVYRQYLLEKFRNEPVKIDVGPSYQNGDYVPKKIEINLPTLDELPKTHFAREYIEKRKIPKKFLSELFFASNWKQFVSSVVPEQNVEKIPNDEKRIVIPFYDYDKNLVAFQGRALGDVEGHLRYMTIKVDKFAAKIYGLHNHKNWLKTYILEGPFDSMFLDNALAAAGANLLDLLPFVNKDNTVIIYDNEPKNPQIVGQMENAVIKGFSIFLWPKHITCKDINELILNDFTQSEVEFLIDNNTFKGLEAKLKLKAWKRT